jgi:putative ABC transport system permease protein
MDLREHVHQAVESLADHPRRAVASAMGVFWGAAAVVLLLAWASGFRAFMRHELAQFGRACVFVMPGVTSSGFPGHRGGVRVRLSRQDSIAAERANVDRIQAVIPEHLSDRRLLAEARGYARRLDLAASDERFAVYRNFGMAHGRTFDADDMQQRRAVAVLGYEAAEALYGEAASAIGQALRVEGRAFEVIGVAHRKGRQYFNTNRPDNRLLMVPITTAESVLGYDERSLGRLNIYPRAGVAPEQALRAALATLGPRAGFHPDDVDAVRWFDISQPSRISEMFYFGFMIFTGVAGTVTLLIGAVGIANHQLATLAERTVEIAVAKALGARNRTLVLQTTIESVLVSGGTAILGVGVGLLGCVALATLPPPGLFPVPIISPAAVVVTAAAILAVAVVAAVVPALRVRRMEIAAALRSGL